jgi:hypothetical protein
MGAVMGVTLPGMKKCWKSGANPCQHMLQPIANQASHRRHARRIPYKQIAVKETETNRPARQAGNVQK